MALRLEQGGSFNLRREAAREAIRLDAQADMAPGIDYVVVARRDVLTLPFEQLKDELSRRVARMKQPQREPATTERRPSKRPSGSD